MDCPNNPSEYEEAYEYNKSIQHAVFEPFEKYYEKEIHHGRLYPNLDTLVDKGLLEKGEKDRRTNVYSVTSRGRREIEDRRDWESQYVEDLL